MRAERGELVHVQGVETELARGVDVVAAVQRPAQPRLHRALGIDQALLDRALEHRAVEVLDAVVRLPHVGVRVKVDERQRAVDGGRRAQLGEHHRVVVAQAQRDDARLVHGAQERLDPLERLDV
ncbi:MAG: hypothetical protein M3P50_04250 [Actinomycetota bacterium]|nr:hypothetical protein [Actinomycetota bacterium]